MSFVRSRARNRDREHVEAVEEILAEGVVGDGGLEVAIGRRDDADVDLHRLVAAEPLDGALLNHPQQLDLNLERQVADLVEEDRRSVGGLEPADLARQRPGEGATLAAERSLSMRAVGIAAQLTRIIVRR
jgi:hypothetical protein